jgi:hypothetical protein
MVLVHACWLAIDLVMLLAKEWELMWVFLPPSSHRSNVECHKQRPHHSHRTPYGQIEVEYSNDK